MSRKSESHHLRLGTVVDVGCWLFQLFIRAHSVFVASISDFQVAGDFLILNMTFCAKTSALALALAFARPLPFFLADFAFAMREFLSSGHVAGDHFTKQMNRCWFDWHMNIGSMFNNHYQPLRQVDRPLIIVNHIQPLSVTTLLTTVHIHSLLPFTVAMYPRRVIHFAPSPWASVFFQFVPSFSRTSQWEKKQFMVNNG